MKLYTLFFAMAAVIGICLVLLVLDNLYAHYLEWREKQAMAARDRKRDRDMQRRAMKPFDRERQS
jgi:hypothetical protein